MDISAFSLGDMLRCGLELRAVGKSARSMEEAARAAVRYFADVFRDPVTGERQCALARFYKTQRYEALPPDLQVFSRTLLDSELPGQNMKCLALLATKGEREQWNDRRRSLKHRAIPLPSPDVVKRAPMIAQLITQFGLDIASIVHPAPDLVRELEGRTYNVFHVREANGSPWIPAQEDFVIPHGIASVMGFGGLIGSDLFAVILFSRTTIPDESAARFRNIALDVKALVHGFTENQIFEQSAPGNTGRPDIAATHADGRS